jgi:hypothetical protein
VTPPAVLSLETTVPLELQGIITKALSALILTGFLCLQTAEFSRFWLFCGLFSIILFLALNLVAVICTNAVGAET